MEWIKNIVFHGSNNIDIEVHNDYGIEFIYRKFLGIFGKETHSYLLLDDLLYVRLDPPTWYKQGVIEICSRYEDLYRIKFTKKQLLEANYMYSYLRTFALNNSSRHMSETSDMTVNVNITLDDAS